MKKLVQENKTQSLNNNNNNNNDKERELKKQEYHKKQTNKVFTKGEAQTKKKNEIEDTEETKMQ